MVLPCTENELYFYPAADNLRLSDAFDLCAHELITQSLWVPIGWLQT